MELQTKLHRFEIATFVKGDSDGPLIVTGVVYAPGQVDTDGDASTPEEIEKAAYRFIASGKVNQIDIYHNEIPTGSVVVGSWVWSEDDGPRWTPGTWLMKVAIFDPTIKTEVKAGRISGFSFHGDGWSEKTAVWVFHPIVSRGTTELSTDDGPLPPHDHDLELKYDDKAVPIQTRTGPRLGHSHIVKAPGATESEFGHAHRLIIDTSGAKEPIRKSVIMNGKDVDPSHLYDPKQLVSGETAHL